MNTEEREEFFAELCAKHNFSLRRIYARGSKYMVCVNSDFALLSAGDLAFIQIYGERDRIRLAFTCKDDEDFPQKTFGTMFTEEMLDPDTLEVNPERAFDVGYCCMCGGECNPASQTCGACPRKMLAPYL
jgi:hypothetical protein